MDFSCHGIMVEMEIPSKIALICITCATELIRKMFSVHTVPKHYWLPTIAIELKINMVRHDLIIENCALEVTVGRSF